METELDRHAALSGETTADVAVIGGGLTGMTTALLLAREGLDVVVVEAGRVMAGTSGYTSAKVSAAHGLIYADLESHLGSDTARVYAEAQQSGLDWTVAFAEGEELDCELRRKPAFTYTEREEERGKIADELAAAQRAGLEVSFTTDTDLPWEVPAAIRYADQAEYHPRKYGGGVTRAAVATGARVFEDSRVLKVREGEPCRIETAGGTVLAGSVVVATSFPILDRALFFARQSAERSYVVGVRVRRGAPQGMYLSTESPSHSVRSHPLGKSELVLVGGESHKVGQGGDTEERYARLERWARDRFPMTSVRYRWAAQDNMPADGLPFVGRLTPRSQHLWVATGFQKWGLTNGVAAAMILRDGILERPNPWADVFDPNRVNARAAAPALVKENVNVGRQLIGDRVVKHRPPDAAALGRGQGGIVSLEGERVAAYRHQDGRLQAVSAVCTHLGCLVRFNEAERSWDCPCHGSRFGLDGEVLQGPAVQALESRSP